VIPNRSKVGYLSAYSLPLMKTLSK